jgi:hypothetical protein
VGNFPPCSRLSHSKIKKYKKARFLIFRPKKQTFSYTCLVLNYSAQTPNHLWSFTQRGATLAEMGGLSTILGQIFLNDLIPPVFPSPPAKYPENSVEYKTETPIVLVIFKANP